MTQCRIGSHWQHCPRPGIEKVMSVTAIGITYAGAEYVISDRSLDEVQAAIADAAAGLPTWLAARMHDGRGLAVKLLIGPGTPVAVWQIAAERRESPREEAPAELGSALD
jgi:hypothetical protein